MGYTREYPPLPQDCILDTNAAMPSTDLGRFTQLSTPGYAGYDQNT